VPVQTLLDYVEAGETINDFLEGFPSVRGEQVVAFLEGTKVPLASIGGWPGTSLAMMSGRRARWAGSRS
jgi:hypothetical protein